MTRPYSGIWPVAPTPFHADGTLDLEGMKRVLDLMIDQGSDDTTNAVSIRKFFQKTAEVAVTEHTSEATVIQTVGRKFYDGMLIATVL